MNYTLGSLIIVALTSHHCQRLVTITQFQMIISHCYKGTSVRIIGADSGSIPTPFPPHFHPPCLPSPPPSSALSAAPLGEVEAQDRKNQISLLSYILMTDGLVKVSEVLANFCLIPINFKGLKEEALAIKITFVVLMDSGCFYSMCLLAPWLCLVLVCGPPREHNNPHSVRDFDEWWTSCKEEAEW